MNFFILTVPKQEVHIEMEIDNGLTASKEINSCSEQCELSRDRNQQKESEPKITFQNNQNLDPGEVSIYWVLPCLYSPFLWLFFSGC